MIKTESLFISIIIPVYNVEKYIKDCLESVFSQNLSFCEVICVNDGSTDNSRSILSQYKQQYEDLIIIDRKNGGLSAARNSGLEVAQGEYVYFLDSDDYLFPGVLEQMKKTLLDNKPQIAVFNALVNGEKKYISGLESIFNKPMTGIEYFKKSYSLNRTVAVPIWLHIYRTDFLLNNKLKFEEGFFYEDELFTPKAFYLAKKIIVNDLSVLFYRYNREGAISSVVTQKHLEDRKKIIHKLYNFYFEVNCTCDEFYRKLFELYIVTYEVLQQKKSNFKIRDFFKKDDFIIIKKCIKTDFERKCFKLSCFNSTLLLKYRDNTINSSARKFINRFL